MSEKIIVQKYGGTSLATGERIAHVARRIAAAARDSRVVVVVSAQGNLTDRLAEKARLINPAAAKREMDMLLATGEQQSAALVAMALQGLGVQAAALTAAQVGIVSDSAFGTAKIAGIDTTRLFAELEMGRIVVVAGFTGYFIGDNGTELTTLGRGASDTTAVAIAAVLKAKFCDILTDVDGIYTADPRLVPGARKHAAISYDDMLELSSSGAQVVHNRAVEMAATYSVPLLVRSSMTDAPGTWIKEANEVEKLSVSGMAFDRNVARITLHGMEDRPGAAYRVFAVLAQAQISVDIIQQGAGKLIFTLHRSECDAARDLLIKQREELGFGDIDCDTNLAKLAVVGAGMATNHGVAAAMFAALYEHDINIEMIATSEIKIAVLIHEQHIAAATQAVHDAFGPGVAQL